MKKRKGGKRKEQKKKKPGDDLISRKSSTIGAEELNCRVRYGNGCVLFAIVTRNCIRHIQLE